MNITTTSTLQTTHITAHIDNNSAELLSLFCYQKEYLYHKDNHQLSAWNIAFPFAGPLQNQSFYFNNKKYTAGNNSFFANEVKWKRTSYSSKQVTFKGTLSPTAHQYYPFVCQFKIVYKVKKNNLLCQITIINKDNQDIYYGLGWEPVFEFATNSGYIKSEYNSKITKMPQSGFWNDQASKFLTQKIILNKLDWKHNQKYAYYQNLNQAFLISDRERLIKITCPHYDYVMVSKPYPGHHNISLAPYASLMDQEFDYSLDISRKKGIIKLCKNKQKKYHIKITVIK